MHLHHVLLAVVALGTACQRPPKSPPKAPASVPERSDKLIRAAEPIPGQYLVSLRAGEDEAGARALAERHGGKLLRYHGALLDVATLNVAPERAVALAEDAAVRLAEEDSVVRIASVPWHLDRVDQRALPLDGQATGTERGKGVHVYVVDTGVLTTHPELVGRADAPLSTVVEPGGAAPPSGDCHGHGTHLAALAAGKTTGVAPGAMVHALRAVDCAGVGAVSYVVAALDWVQANHASPAVALVGVTAGHSPTLSDALRKTLDAGVTVVAPAGNSGLDACGTFPAAYPGVLAVGAVDEADAVTPYSNQGRCVSLFAPGEKLVSAWNDGEYRIASGTSQAAALVAGAAAAFQQHYPQAAPHTVSAALMGNATLGLPSGRTPGSLDRLLYTGFIAPPVSGAPRPTVKLEAPVAGAEVTGTVALRASATGPVTQVAFLADGQYLGADADGSNDFSFSWGTQSLGNGPHTVLARAFDAAGNVAEHSVQVLVTNPSNAGYDADMKAPACLRPGQRCASGSLLTGRGPVGPEVNAPNTLQAACADGASGSYRVDESIESIEVQLAGGAATLAEGQIVNVAIRVWAYPDFNSDEVDLYFTRDALGPQWQYVGTAKLAGAGEQVAHFSYRLPALLDDPPSARRCPADTECAGLQAVRAVLRFGNQPAACTDGRYDDHDDLAFAVTSGAPDTIEPEVRVVSPKRAAKLSGEEILEAEASDDRQVVSRVEFYLNERLLGISTAPDATGHFQLKWNADSVPLSDTSVLTAIAYDASGNSARSAGVLVAVVDLELPTVSITLPIPEKAADGTLRAVVGGIAKIEAVATDNRALYRVLFRRGTLPIGEVTLPPYSLSWDTTKQSGETTLTAEAFDASGNKQTSAAIRVTVDNMPPLVAISSPAAGTEVHGLVEVKGTASDNDQVARVELLVQDIPVAEATIDTATNSWRATFMSGAFPNIPVELVARAYDRVGTVTKSAPLTILVRDTTPPNVVLSLPSPGALVQGLVQVAATVEDEGFLKKVLFYQDGQLLFEDTTPPFEGTWDTRTLTDGPHTLKAVAQDIAENVGESTPLAVTVDNHAPDVTLVYPLPGMVSGAVEIRVRASDTVGVDRVVVAVDGTPLGTATRDTSDGTLYRIAWLTTSFDNRTFSLTAVAIDLIGNEKKSAPVALTVSNPTTAELSAELAAPICAQTAAWCTSGTLLDGVGTSEAHAPNTVAGSCQDGKAGTYHEHESVDRITVRSLDFGPLTAGRQVAVEIQYWAAAANESDQLDVYYATDARNPTWVILGTLTPPKVGRNEAPFLVYTLPTGPLQAIRAAYRFGAKGPTSCSTEGMTKEQLASNYDDIDDLVFAVGTPTDTTPPQVVLSTPVDGGVVAGDVELWAAASDDVGIARVEFLVDGVPLAARNAPPYFVVWPAGEVANGGHTLAVRAYDTSGNSAAVAPITVTVRNIPNAIYDAARAAPTCVEPAGFCDSGSLLDGRSDATQLGPEPNAPNTLQNSCQDGREGVYHLDESIDGLKVSTLDGLPFEPGKRVKVEARVWAYSGFSDDSLDLYYTTSADTPTWVWFATLKPTASGAQVLSAEYTLPPGRMQAVRARFRYGGTAATCAAEPAPMDDVDDLAFGVVY